MNPNEVRFRTDQYSIAGDLGVALSLGKIETFRHVNLRGLNLDIDSGTLPEILAPQGGGFASLSTNSNIQLTVSTTAANIALGVTKIEVEHIDTNWDLQSEVVTLTDDSDHNLGELSKRFISARIVSHAGQTAIPQDDVDIKVGAVVHGRILGRLVPNGGLGHSVGKSAALSYTVPRSHNVFIHSIELSAYRTGSFHGAAAIIKSEGVDATPYSYEVVDVIPFSDSINGRLTGTLPLMIPEKSDVWVEMIEMSASNISISGHAELSIVND